MTGPLAILNQSPCLITVVNDGDEPELVMIEPLRVILAERHDTPPKAIEGSFSLMFFHSTRYSHESEQHHGA